MVNQECKGIAAGQAPMSWGIEEKSQLLLKLYEKAVDCMDRAVDHIGRGEMVEKGDQLIRAQDIVLLLGDVLDDRSGDEGLAVNLRRLYLYVYRLLVRANTHLDIDSIAEARRHMVGLYVAWKQVVDKEGDCAHSAKRARW